MTKGSQSKRNEENKSDGAPSESRRIHQEYLNAAEKVAEMCGYSEHYSAIDALSRQGCQAGEGTPLSALLVALPEKLASAKSRQLKKKTLVITDQFLLKHAGFYNYANIQERVLQKNGQPENAERLMVLIDKDKGVLTKSDEFLKNDDYILREVSAPAKLADILKVHDYRYIKDLMKKCQALEENDDEMLAKYDRDSMISAETWQAALMASGAVIEACEKVMVGECTNAFCAIRPPGHHAGVFGRTFKDNQCDQE